MFGEKKRCTDPKVYTLAGLNQVLIGFTLGEIRSVLNSLSPRSGKNWMNENVTDEVAHLNWDVDHVDEVRSSPITQLAH